MGEWRSNKNSGGVFVVMSDRSLVFVAEALGATKEIRVKRAELIVLACNSHAKLQKQAKSQPALFTICTKIKQAGDDTMEDCHEFLSRLDDLWDELEAALEAAKGKE